jgi:hypothetical protein
LGERLYSPIRRCQVVSVVEEVSSSISHVAVTSGTRCDMRPNGRE